MCFVILCYMFGEDVYIIPKCRASTEKNNLGVVHYLAASELCRVGLLEITRFEPAEIQLRLESATLEKSRKSTINSSHSLRRLMN